MSNARSGPPTVGFVLGSSFHPSELVRAARAIESSGFESIWCTEDYFMTGGIAGAASVLGATQRISVGTGLLSVYTRHPALVAMEASTLASVHRGRFRLGIGVGGLFWLDQQGIDHARPLAAVRGYTAALRELFAGEELTGEYGAHQLSGVRLNFLPDAAPPIYIGATGPKMTALAGELADGLLLSVFSSPEFVRIQRQIVTGAAPGPRPMTTLAFWAPAASLEAARAMARPVLASYLADMEASVMTDAIGITEELRTLVAKGGEESLRAGMPDNWIDRLTVCGDVDTCIASINALGVAGADEVALVPLAASTGALVSAIQQLGSALKAG